MSISTASFAWKSLALSPNAITQDPRFQPREGLNDATVSRYVRAMERGEVFPPIKVAAVARGKLCVIDGFHRLEAAKRLGRDTIAADIARMTPEQAVAYALDANVTHGLALNRKDKRRVFQRYVEEKFHLHPNGNVKSLRLMREELGGIAAPATISAWLRQAGIEASDLDEIKEWSRPEDHAPEDALPATDAEALEAIEDHLRAIEAHYAMLEDAEGQATVTASLHRLIQRLAPTRDGLDI